ncbi:MAG: serine/threonine protein kinase [Caldilineaceae bacterium SB0661_bin_32]|uniref:Serine/threonine protein kinase n=1 Tax=Caldilineaceae bacterium SB0661_bin_32 TaxID=2605255 RepID=A0A6B1D7M2_9CHLR|nr:serine/threonine protein kinase [Caldilineaceae bacterium SB0661_bin_32]
MSHPLLDRRAIEQPPGEYLSEIGKVYAVFDAQVQDSGNISYGVQVGKQRFFVKAPGDPHDPRPFLPHEERVALLHNAVHVRRSCSHGALPRLHNVIESAHGPLLVYSWVEGELLHAGSATRQHPHSAMQRFRRLPLPEITKALDLIYELHYELAQSGWIAVDFYDGCLIYDFASREMHVVDLDMYRRSPFVNEMGRMFGSSRYMAPEEFERGAWIDERTNVFTMGRTAANLLSDGTLARSAFRGSDAHYDIVLKACSDERRMRYASVGDFYAAWLKAGNGEP